MITIISYITLLTTAVLFTLILYIGLLKIKLI